MCVYIHIYIHTCLYVPASANKNSSGEEDAREGRLSEHRIGGWRAVFLCWIACQHLPAVFCTDAGMINTSPTKHVHASVSLSAYESTGSTSP